jgi:hypothetical protein
MSRAPLRYSTALLASVWALVLTGACSQDTSRLTPEQEARFQKEGVLRRADNIVFHYTRAYGFRREETREDRLASIVVTPRSVLIHKNGKVGVEITPSRRFYDVHRRGARVLVHAGSGRSTEIWSFEPPSDAEGWTRDIRSVIRRSRD